MVLKEQLKNYLDYILPLNEEEWNAFSDLFEPYTLKKGDFFASAGKIENKIGFLSKGVVRAYFSTKEGLEYNKTFFVAYEFFGAYSSLVSQSVNQINIQALTDCELLVADYSKVVTLFQLYRSIETLARIVAERFYIEKEKRELQLVLLQADERYDLFQKEYQGLENLIPQYHIASYLGITPTQLSRIRAKIK